MKSILRIVGYILWVGSGILTFIFWFIAMSHWLGFLGVILSFVLSPGIVIFPIIFWIVEGVFPITYFIIWGIGILGLIITGASSSD